MRLYAFLGEGAVATLTGFRWPTPAGAGAAPWVEAGADAPREAVRGCTLEELPAWLDDELWELELDGRAVEDGRCVYGERGRLVRRIEGWTPELAESLVDACASRVEHAADELAAADDETEAARMAGFASDVTLYARDAASPGAAAAVAAYVAAHALAGGDRAVRTYGVRFEDERRWQVEWLRERLRL